MEISYHAKERMLERNITLEQVKEIIVKGVKLQDSDGLNYIYKGYRAVVCDNILITVSAAKVNSEYDYIKSFIPNEKKEVKKFNKVKRHKLRRRRLSQNNYNKFCERKRERV